MHFLLLLGLLVGSLWAVESSMGTSGYLRIQTSLQDGKENVCFKLPTASTKYRLGNECETWMELNVYQDLKFDNGVVVHNSIRPVFLGANNENIEFLRFDEAYSEVSGLFDGNSAKLWAGRRFYQRYDSFLNDYFFLNMSGDGLGVSDIDVEGVKLSYSLMFNQIDLSSVAGNEKVLFLSHDLRLVKETSRGEWTLFLNYMSLEDKTFSSGDKLSTDTDNGFALGLLYKDKKIFNELWGMQGENITGLFYGQGVAKGAGAYSPYLREPMIDNVVATGSAIDDAKTLRFINYNSLENDDWGLMTNLVYEYRDDEVFEGVKQHWFSVGARSFWFAKPNIRLVLEVGYDSVSDEIIDETYALTKATAAVEFALEKGIWKRPVVRLYYTQAYWSDSAVGLVSTDYYADKNSGNTLGIQLEYWW